MSYTLPDFLTPFPVLVTPFLRTFINKSNANNGINLLSCPFPVIAFINEEATGCINKEAIGDINEAATGATKYKNSPKKSTFVVFILCFNVSVVPSFNRLDLSSDPTILMMS